MIPRLQKGDKVIYELRKPKQTPDDLLFYEILEVTNEGYKYEVTNQTMDPVESKGEGSFDMFDTVEKGISDITTNRSGVDYFWNFQHSEWRCASCYGTGIRAGLRVVKNGQESFVSEECRICQGYPIYSPPTTWINKLCRFLRQNGGNFNGIRSREKDE